MICRKCMAVMKSGTSYEKRKGEGRPSARRFHECRKCGDKIYANESNFIECLKSVSDKYRRK